MGTEASRQNWINRIVAAFMSGNLSVLLILVSLLAGLMALWITPREEDPQIVVPIADVFVSMPGASAREVERQVSTRLEKLLYQIDGVEYVYSMSLPSLSVVTVRFYVGEDRERSWVKLRNKIQANIDQIPPGVKGWVVKPIEIDDVPIVNLTLYSPRYSDFELRRMAEELEIRLQSVKNAGRTFIVGGRSREITVALDPQRMASRGVALEDIQSALQGANASLSAGDLIKRDRAIRFHPGEFLSSARDIENLVVGVHRGRPVFLKELAEVRDGPQEPECYTRILFGPGAFGPADPASERGGIPPGIERYRDYPQVTVAVAKRKGTNAVWVSEEVQREAAEFAREALPEGVHLRITRDYGKTADDKVNGLVEALAVAIIIVVALLAYSLGWREGIIIALAVPITFSFTLLINYLMGYSINRVTLFALILSLGLVVDDPIVDVENIHRHFAMKERDPFNAVLEAVNEVRPPIIIATLAVIISFIPMFFITGMMGPYMAPMALNVPVAMFMSMLVAFTITPWLSYHVLKGIYNRPHKPFVLKESPLYRAYQSIMTPFFDHRALRWALLLALVLLLGFAGWLVASRRVPLKMLPFDNKNELQIVVDMPEGTTLESTEACVNDLAQYLARIPEVTDVSTFAGTSSPMDFNGMVRHYYLRRAPNVGDIRIGFLEKKRRSQQSHAIGLRLRRELTRIASRHGADVKVIEIPPGPPVISTLVAEVYGPLGRPYEDLEKAARRIRGLMEQTPGVVDVDDVLVAPQTEYIFSVDRAKAALHGIDSRRIVSFLAGATIGNTSASLRLDEEVHPVLIRLKLPKARRTMAAQLLQLPLRSPSGGILSLSELGRLHIRKIEQPIYHKNLHPVVYVFGETAGLPPPEAVLSVNKKVRRDPFLRDFRITWAGEGEWKITLRVFRDLGAAFGVAIIGIYILLLMQTQSYLLPAIQLIALPLSIIGILPGFWVLNALVGETIDGWSNPVYFTATAMIGMIALAGIATRNSILYIEFVRERMKEGKPLVHSLVEAGALRTRPIFLTSAAAMLGAWPITLDPIFSGLAWALIFGLLVSTLFTLLVIPVVYYMAYAKRYANHEKGGERY